MTKPLLIELLTEELPPKALNHLGNSFATMIVEGLQKAQLIEGDVCFQAYATPRRLAVCVDNVQAMQADQVVLKKGPAVAHAMQNGEPTKALIGFARSCGADIGCLKVVFDGKQEVYAYEFIQKGKSLAQLLEDILLQAIKKLPIPKVMRWGSSTHTFVRPVHGLVMLHGDQVVSGSVLGLQSGRETWGRRFVTQQAIVLKDAGCYAEQLAQEGKVIASFAERKAIIQAALTQYATQLHAQVAMDETLLDEVTALVEWPVVLKASFEAHFLNVPQECLILTMQQNQKYFPLLNQDGKLINQFLLVSNLDAKDPNPIIHGNERVLRARLSDAEFFYKQDQKHSLESRLSRLSQVVYHHQLGSQAERVERLVEISGHIAKTLASDVAITERAARLAKADLLTEMVGEFPELQGTMGKYYALIDGEPPEIANAIEQHYRPRFAGDKLPESHIATAVALADKLETLVGIWGIGLIPTGDKDPYALRRCALGVVRMLMNYPLNINELLQYTYQVFPQGKLAETTVAEVADFIQARLAVWLHQDYPQDVVAAVLANRPKQWHDLVAKLQAVAEFKQLPEASELIAANKRVHNLLKKATTQTTSIQENLFSQPAEQALYQASQDLQPTIQAAMQDNHFQAALTALATIKPQVDAFFEQVMVMDQNETIKQNRLNLLAQLAQQMNAVADISLLTA